MTTSNEPLFTQVGVVPPSASGASAYDHIEGMAYEARTEKADEGLADAPVRVPLYLIAAAALLGRRISRAALLAHVTDHPGSL